ncbi:MAG TPA: 2-oxoacid:acceptor oxidoreductase subunit alpha, partial [Haliea salexigens]|nr:2-oxoacid:acceptor oxidoreductase subunit alpha [Haliea salexigens]
GLEHNERGTPSARASDHHEQLDKRRRKLETFDFGADWGRCDGTGDTALVSFGSASAAADEAAARLAERGTSVRTVALRLLAPLPLAGLERALAGCSRVVVVEQNHGAQLYHYLKGRLNLPLESLAIPGPVPLNPETIAEVVGARQVT